MNSHIADIKKLLLDEEMELIEQRRRINDRLEEINRALLLANESNAVSKRSRPRHAVPLKYQRTAALLSILEEHPEGIERSKVLDAMPNNPIDRKANQVTISIAIHQSRIVVQVDDLLFKKTP